MPGRTALPMIASGAMRKPDGQAGVGINRGWRVAGCFGEYCIDRVSIVDGEFCCLRPGALWHVRAKPRAARPERSEVKWRAGGPALRWRRSRALKGPVLKTKRKLSGSTQGPRLLALA